MMIREMIADDIPEVAQLYKQFWHEASCIESMVNQFDKFCRSDTYILLSAVDNRRLIGSVMGIICGDLYGNCKPFMVVENMIVDRSYRNKGVGKALIAKLEALATDKGCTQIILVTETNRIDACKFYQSAGYSPNTGFKKKLL